MKPSGLSYTSIRHTKQSFIVVAIGSYNVPILTVTDTRVSGLHHHMNCHSRRSTSHTLRDARYLRKTYKYTVLHSCWDHVTFVGGGNPLPPLKIPYLSRGENEIVQPYTLFLVVGQKIAAQSPQR